jgi:ribonucleoside-diphosphate reductase alpha chain
MADAAWVCGDPGIQYDTTINDWNPVSNSARQYATNPCSEFSFINDSSCNLASLNLMKFVRDDGEFDVEGFRYASRLTITAQEILVDNAGYPTPPIGENSHRFRPLGLGYANLGALLMNRGLAYDSSEGQAYAGAITSVMTAEAYRQSAIIARDHGGPFAEYRKNEKPFLRVIEKHRDAAHGIPDKQSVPADLHRAARDIWDETLSLGQQFGYRSAQVSLLAPTGTIAFMMDCDTTGIEPDIALVKYKKLVGEGFLKIVNQTVPGALRKLGYTPEQVDSIVAYVNERETIEGAPELKPEHLSVFDCAFKPMNGTRSIHYMGHLRMMSAVQPFLSGAISKTVNMPEAATPDEIETVYLEGWRMGLKAIAIYRDNSKRSQPLMTGKKKDKELELAAPVAASAPSEPKPYRRRLPAERTAITHKFDISGHEGYITVGLYPDGTPGEIFLKMAKEGSTISGLMDTFATTVSVALQYGVPLHDLVHKFAHVRFEPSGFTSNPEIPIAKSIVDYIFRWMGSRFLPPEERANLGLVDRSATAESSVQPLNLGLGGSDAAGSGGAGTSGSAASGAAGPASSLSGDAGKAGPTTVVAAPDSTPVAGEPPAREWPNDSPRSSASPASGSANVTAPGKSNGNGNGTRNTLGSLGIGKAQVTFAAQADAPSCAECGSIMVRNGSCYKCLNCGSTSGCS